MRTGRDRPPKPGPDRLSQSGRTRINVEDDASVLSWSRRFGVTVEQLKLAVDQVGSDADDVGNYLRGEGKRAAKRQPLPED